MKLRKTVLAAAVALTSAVSALACPANVATNFTSGPLDAAGMFSSYIVDSNGVGLQMCNLSVTNDGNPPPCFFDPVVPGNLLSEALGRGNEAFMFLSDSVFTTTGAFPIDAVIVMGVEAAFLSPEPTAGFQTQFQRLRTRLNVNAVGIYTVETPWGIKTYRVDTLLKPGNGQNRAEVSDPIDISFGANSSVPGLVSPFLVATPEIPGYGAANGYIGDGLTLTNVSGSPCGQNYIQITATGLDGVTPIDIGGNVRNPAGAIQSHVYRNSQFTTMGRRMPGAPGPLAISSAYYTRINGATSVTVMAQGSAAASATATLTVDGVSSTMQHEAGRFYGTAPVAGLLPASVSVTTSDTLALVAPNTQTATLKDLVTISSAEARCSGSGVNKSCVLRVVASSSDDGSGGVAPTLTLGDAAATPLVNGVVSTVSNAIPAAVSVTSSALGVAVKPVTVINQ
ncbi:MAG: hypothetical protein RIQ60_142 [Pseudomonadota bacterium]